RAGGRRRRGGAPGGGRGGGGGGGRRAGKRPPIRRYDTAVGLAADVQRHLAGEPVLAHPPSATYRLRKLLRRYRGPVVAATALALALFAGIVGTTWGLLRAEARRAEAEQAREESQKHFAQVEKANAILTSIFDN